MPIPMAAASSWAGVWQSQTQAAAFGCCGLTPHLDQDAFREI
jgi:hypothetical protein